MPVEFLGMIGVKPSEDNAAVHIIGGGISREYLCEFTRAHEDSDFDGVLVGYTSGAADGLHVAQAAADCTDRIKFLIAHRPGFVAPTLAARKFATLDYFTGGRVSVHIITGGHDVEQQRDGDWKDHDERYRRTGEYLSIMRRTWEHDAHGREPFDFDGEFYQVVGQNPEALPVQPGGIPLYFGGASDIAFEIGVKHCDVYMMWGEPRASIAATIERIHEMAAVYGRKPRLSVSFRPIIAPTEDQAWEKAHSYLNKVTQLSKQPLDFRPQSRGSQRLLEFAAKGDVQRRASVDADRGSDRRRRQYLRARRHARAGRRSPAQVHRPRRLGHPDSRLRSAARHDRLRQRAHPDGQGRSRPPRFRGRSASRA